MYWLARMLEGGENPLYIARRLIRCSTEDVGLADPQALLITTNCYKTCQDLGSPLCFPTLAQCVTYLALTRKSNELYIAYTKLRDLIHDGGPVDVPLSVKRTPEYDYTPGRSFLPLGLEKEVFVDLSRAFTDRREQSLNRFMASAKPDEESLIPDANVHRLPLSKRAKLSTDPS